LSGHILLNRFLICYLDIANKFQINMVSLQEMLIGDVKKETEKKIDSENFSLFLHAISSRDKEHMLNEVSCSPFIATYIVLFYFYIYFTINKILCFEVFQKPENVTFDPLHRRCPSENSSTYLRFFLSYI
jgi:hypothetical protein